MRAPKPTQRLARSLRRQMTKPEVLIWVRIRRRQPGYPAFRRQHPFEPYVLDFYCAEARLCVEIDGYVHGTGDLPRRDEGRDAFLATRGVKVWRISASEVMEDADEVAHGIAETARALAAGPLHHPADGPPPPFPLVTGEELTGPSSSHASPKGAAGEVDRREATRRRGLRRP